MLPESVAISKSWLSTKVSTYVLTANAVGNCVLAAPDNVVLVDTEVTA